MNHDVEPRNEYICSCRNEPSGQASQHKVTKEYIITCVLCRKSTLFYDTLAKCHQVWDKGCVAGSF